MGLFPAQEEDDGDTIGMSIDDDADPSVKEEVGGCVRLQVVEDVLSHKCETASIHPLQCSGAKRVTHCLLVAVSCRAVSLSCPGFSSLLFFSLTFEGLNLVFDEESEGSGSRQACPLLNSSSHIKQFAIRDTDGHSSAKSRGSGHSEVYKCKEF